MAGAPAVLTGMALLAWVVVIAGTIAGGGVLLDHDRIFASGVPSLSRVAGFGGAWLVMIAAMMLPGTALRLTDRPCDPARNWWALFAGYFIVWEVFGLGLLVIDGLIHYAVGTNVWMQRNTYVVAAATLGLVAIAQFYFSRRRSVLRVEPRAVTAPSSSLVAGIGLGCENLVGCGAIMIFMMAASLHDPVTMGVCAVIGAYQQCGRWGAGLARALGIVALADAVFILALRTSTL